MKIAALKRFGSCAGVYLFATCLSFLVSAGLNLSSAGVGFGPVYAIAQEPQSGIPAGWESYLDRPDILSVKPQAKIPNENWNKLKAAHFAFVAQLLEMYPKNTEIYFLARDSEHLYDVARLVTEKTADASRIHLLNVSRANMRDPNLRAYLSENGISEETLRQGKQVLFVDTGFAGTIPRVISEGFPLELREKLKTHLVVSSNPAHPSSRAFLVHLNPTVNGQAPGGMHGTIINYEHMPRYTDRSSRYVSIDSRFHPISLIGKSSDGSVSKSESLKYMADLRAEWSDPSARMWFLEQRETLRKLKSQLSDNSESAKALILEDLNRLSKTNEGRLFEAYLRDAVEMKKNAALTVQYSLSDFGLKDEVRGAYGSSHSKKAELIEKYPEWKSALEDPVTEIPKLFEQKNWQMIGNLIDASVDSEINHLLFKYLYDAPATGVKRSMQVSAIEKADQLILRYLSEYTFSQPHTSEMRDLIKMVIEKADHETLRYLSQYTFSQSHTSEMRDLIKMVIEKADHETLRYLSQYTFSRPHTSEMRDLIKMVIEKADQLTLRMLSWYTFSRPHTSEMRDLIKMVIEKADQLTLRYLSQYTFSQPHTSEMRDLIKMVIEKADQETLRYLSQYTFSQPHTKGTEFEIFRKATIREFTSPEERKKWMDQEFLKIGSPLAGGVSVKVVSPSLKPGDQIEIKNRKLTVVKVAGDGRRGVVFQIKAENGAFYALKVAKDQSAETLNSLAQESAKAKAWQELKIPHAKVLVQENTYVLKPWINGMSGEEAVQKFASGDPAMKGAAQAVIQLVSKILNQGAYIGDFRPANLIWNGRAWVIIDSGSIQKGMMLEEAQAKWNAADKRGPKFERRWQIKPPQLPRICRDIFAAA